MDNNALAKQVVDLATQIRALQRATSTLQRENYKLKQEIRHLKARNEATGHSLASILRALNSRRD